MFMIKNNNNKLTPLKPLDIHETSIKEQLFQKIRIKYEVFRVVKPIFSVL